MPLPFYTCILSSILLSSYRFWILARSIYASAGMHSQLLRLLVGHQWLKSLFELLNGHLSAVPMLHSTVDGLGWDENIAHNVDDTI